MDRPIRLGITMGDPAGIGPEVVVKVFADPAVRSVPNLVVLGDAGYLRRAAEQLNVDFPCPAVSSCTPLEELPPGAVVWDFANAKDVPPGRPSREGGVASLQYIERAVDLALAGRLDAIVTGPINKMALVLAGTQWPGHTEFLAQRTHTRHPVMMLVGRSLRVALVTTHLALRKVPGALNVENVLATLRVTDREMKSLFGIAAPRLAVCGLNPHASDGGRFGNEEARVIEPAIRKAKESGIAVSGPHPPDAVFHQAAGGRYDAVIAMYHDQGLIPLKLLHFEDAVNVTLGLPIIRTSVDHGTAYDIVGRGQANAASMLAAIRLAAGLAARRRAISSDR